MTKQQKRFNAVSKILISDNYNLSEITNYTNKLSSKDLDVFVKCLFANLATKRVSK